MDTPDYQIQILKVPVSDIDRAVQFYSDHLRLELQFAAAEYGWAQFSADDLSLALYKPDMGGGNGQIGGSVDFHLALPEEAFQTLADALLEGGHLVDDQIHKGNDGSTFMDVKDPDGNIIKVMQC